MNDLVDDPGDREQHDKQPPSDKPTPSDAPRRPGSFTAITKVKYDPAELQAAHLLRMRGVTLVVVPPGACGIAVCGYFAGFFTGKFAIPFGTARRPGDFWVSTHIRDADKSIAAFLSGYPTTTEVFTRWTRRAFNWRQPALTFKDVRAEEWPKNLAAVIIDAGHFPQRTDEAIVESAFVALDEMAEEKNCQIMVVVESTSRSPDPFERIPRSLRVMRGSLLVVPIAPKSIGLDRTEPAEFMLMRLHEAAPQCLTVRFSLHQAADPFGFLPEGSRILWGPIALDDPRAAFRRAQVSVMTQSQRDAIVLAVELVEKHGRMTREQLQAAAQLRGIAKTTMRDALTLGNLLGYLGKVKDQFDGHWYWIVPVFAPRLVQSNCPF